MSDHAIREAALRWAHAARGIYERETSRVGITGLHKAAIGDVLEGVSHVQALTAGAGSPAPSPREPIAKTLRRWASPVRFLGREADAATLEAAAKIIEEGGMEDEFTIGGGVSGSAPATP